jgi:hypothetical protein
MCCLSSRSGNPRYCKICLIHIVIFWQLRHETMGNNNFNGLSKFVKKVAFWRWSFGHSKVFRWPNIIKDPCFPLEHRNIYTSLQTQHCEYFKVRCMLSLHNIQLVTLLTLSQLTLLFSPQASCSFSLEYMAWHTLGLQIAWSE